MHDITYELSEYLLLHNNVSIVKKVSGITVTPVV